MSIKRHTFYNLTGSIVPMAVALVTLPLCQQNLGPSRAAANHVAELRNALTVKLEPVFSPHGAGFST